jgi:hypothetical protein
MIEDVAAVNPNTIVVINSGGPVVMPWLNNVAGCSRTGTAAGRPVPRRRR